jgi:hypothetical protein
LAQHNAGPLEDPPLNPLPFHAVFDTDLYAEIRRAHSQPLRPRSVAGLENRIRTLANERLDELLPRSSFDLTQEYGGAGYDPALCPAQAFGLQPLACVLYACEQLPDLAGRHVAIIGQGSIGLLFAYVAKVAGARRVTGVAPVDRENLSPTYGVDDAVRATSDRWVSQLAAGDRTDVASRPSVTRSHPGPRHPCHRARRHGLLLSGCR